MAGVSRLSRLREEHDVKKLQHDGSGPETRDGTDDGGPDRHPLPPCPRPCGRARLRTVRRLHRLRPRSPPHMDSGRGPCGAAVPAGQPLPGRFGLEDDRRSRDRSDRRRPSRWPRRRCLRPAGIPPASPRLARDADPTAPSPVTFERTEKRPQLSRPGGPAPCLPPSHPAASNTTGAAGSALPPFRPAPAFPMPT